MTEEAKRLSPKRKTLRELYLKSGNRCAFPGCERALLTSQGVFVGQVCHIEAAEPGGQRFNQKQTNEERRQPSNLVLMCYEHHVETDDASKFPVEVMNKIKEEHEKKFADVVGVIYSAMTDHTDLSNPVEPTNLYRLAKALKWKLTDDELQVTLTELLSAIDSLSRLPIPTRQFLAILIKRSRNASWKRDELVASFSDIQQATQLNIQNMKEFISILTQHRIIRDVWYDEYEAAQLSFCEFSSGWSFWHDLKSFCDYEKLDVSQFIEHLDFSLLDEI